MNNRLIFIFCLLAVLLTVKSIANEIGWDCYAVFPIRRDSEFSQRHASWVKRMESGDLLKVASETMTSIATDDDNYVTARIFAECMNLRGATSDFDASITKLATSKDRQEIADYIKFAYEDSRLRKEEFELTIHANDPKIDNTALTMSIEKRRKVLWDTYKIRGATSLPFLAILSMNVSADVSERRKLAELFVHNNPSNRNGKLILARLSANGRFLYSVDRKTSKPIADRWGNILWRSDQESKPEYEKSLQLCQDLLAQNKEDSRPYYYMSYVYAQEYTYESVSPTEKKKLLDKSMEYMRLFLKGKDLPEILRKSANAFLERKVPAFDLRQFVSQ